MAEKRITSPRDFPAIEELLQSAELRGSCLPRPVIVQIARAVVASAKESLQDGKSVTHNGLLAKIAKEVRAAERMTISRVINATGVVVHTNLGRAPLAPGLFDHIREAVTGYSNVEFNLATGQRGSRGEACEQYLATLAEAEAGTVVNNCAAALFVSLCALAKGKYVVISRGELVQIGGGFRIPDILRQSGAKLREIGTTNITTLDDYRNAIDSDVAVICKVHKSNFVQSGFTEDVPLKDLVVMGREHNVPVLNDLGSGVFVPTQPIIGYTEPTVQQSVRAGADLTCFSGDKLLGGMQAGLIVGKSEIIRKIKRHPLFRAVRVDKVVLSSLEYLLRCYLDDRHQQEITLWSMLATPVGELERRANEIVTAVGKPGLVQATSLAGYVGGGASPEVPVPSFGLRVMVEKKADLLLRQLREYAPPIIGRIEDDRLVLDLRAVEPADDAHIIEALKTVVGS